MNRIIPDQSPGGQTPAKPLPVGSPPSRRATKSTALDILSLGGLSIGNGPFTRSIGEASTSGYIPADALHWAIEPFIPIEPNQWVQYLASCSELKEKQQESLRHASLQIEQAVLHETAAWQCEFAASYRGIDPDRDTKDLLPLNRPTRNSATELDQAQLQLSDLHSKQIEASIELSCQILEQAAYKRLDQSQIEECVGVASQWGVPLHVDFDLFETLIVYARGDIVGNRVKRQWRRLYRREMVEVPIYQRMVVLFQLRQDQDTGETLAASSLHMRMFKNIPKQDIDMLLPGTKVRLSGVDRAKIVLPSIGGLLMSARKIASYALLFAVLALHWTAILAVLVLGYLAKSFLSYFQTKNRHQLNLTRNLYFQKLDTNAGVGFHLASQAASQSQVEYTVAYFAVSTHDEPISSRKLRRKCERIIREAIEIEIDFQVDRAVTGLAAMNMIRKTDKGWTLV